MHPRMVQALVSPTTSSIWQAGWRLCGGLSPKRVRFFHQVDDPHSHQLLCLLPELSRRFNVQVLLHVVPPPTPDQDPEPELAMDFIDRDAREWARLYEVEPVGQRAWTDEDRRAAQSRFLAMKGPDLLEQAVELSRALWAGATVDAVADPTAGLAAHQARLHRGGYYRGGSVFFEGEHYPGLARWRMLEAHLGGREGSILRPRSMPEPAVSRAKPGAELQWFYSFRSPYSYLSVEPVRRLVDTYDVQLKIRPVLPMVMRGLQVPFRKRLFLVRDAKRVALQRQQPFGLLADPLGLGVERLLAVYPLAEARGHGLDFLQAAGRAVWAEGVDVATDEGLFGVAESAEISPEEVKAAILDEGWRAMAEDNQADLLAHKLWGVPAFVMDGFSTWGQDRLFQLQARLSPRA